MSFFIGICGFVFEGCWHRYGRWEDTIVHVTSDDYDPYEYSIQIRSCEKCGIKVRRTPR